MGSISWNTAWCSSVCSQCWSSSLCARNKQAAILEIKTTEQTMAGITATDQTSAVCSTDHCWNCPDSAQSLCSLMMMLCHLINLELTNNLTLGHQYQLSPTHQPCLLINLEPKQQYLRSQQQYVPDTSVNTGPAPKTNFPPGFVSASAVRAYDAAVVGDNDYNGPKNVLYFF